MASLKEIMNIDEDSFDSDPLKRAKESVPRSSRAPDSIPSTSSYASPTESSFPPSSEKLPTQRPSTLSHHPSVTASPSPGPSNPDSRRRSNTSSDSMDPFYYGQGHGYASGSMASSATDPRAYPATAPPNESPFKLTPITGRVSRAKKGVPVHICQECTKVSRTLTFATNKANPYQTFTRAEHLR